MLGSGGNLPVADAVMVDASGFRASKVGWLAGSLVTTCPDVMTGLGVEASI